MTKRLLITGGVLVAAIGLWLVLLWQPKTASLAQADDRSETAETANAGLEAQVRALRADQEETEALAAEAARLRDALPPDARLGEIVLELDEVARAAGVDLRAVQPSEPVPGTSGVSEIGISLTVQGGYDSAVGFVARLGAMRRLVVVDAVDLAAPKDSAGVLTVSVRARAFVRGGA